MTGTPPCPPWQARIGWGPRCRWWAAGGGTWLSNKVHSDSYYCDCQAGDCRCVGSDYDTAQSSWALNTNNNKIEFIYIYSTQCQSSTHLGLQPFHLTKYSVFPFLILFFVIASAAKTWPPSSCSSFWSMVCINWTSFASARARNSHFCTSVQVSIFLHFLYIR